MVIREVKTAPDLNQFLDLTSSLYRNYPCYVPQLRKDLRDKFSPKNPFFRHAEARYYLAEHEGSVVGRISSALFEYLLQVPANRIGYTALTLPQLKILQEAISLTVFVPFVVFYMRQPLKLDNLWAAVCIMGEVYFVFRR